MKSLALYPSTNSKGKHDGTYFRALADRWARRHGGKALMIDTSPSRPRSERFRQVVSLVEQELPEILVCFCHGLRDCLPQFGVCCRPVPSLGMLARNVDIIAGALAFASSAPRVFLAACTTGDDLVPGIDGPPGGDGGLADQWRDSMVKHGAGGAQVDAHDRAGDSVANPYVRRFLGPEDKEHIGGQWIVVPPGHGDVPNEPFLPIRWHRWDKWIEGRGWEEYPMLTRAEIRARLDA